MEPSFDSFISNTPLFWVPYFTAGMLMPLYIILVLDLARGNGVMARFFALPGTGFLGETGFSIFIWQGVLIVLCFISLSIYPTIASYQHSIAIVMIMAITIASTYLFEKPLARFIKRKYINTMD